MGEYVTNPAQTRRFELLSRQRLCGQLGERATAFLLGLTEFIEDEALTNRAYAHCNEVPGQQTFFYKCTGAAKIDTIEAGSGLLLLPSFTVTFLHINFDGSEGDVECYFEGTEEPDAPCLLLTLTEISSRSKVAWHAKTTFLQGQGVETITYPREAGPSPSTNDQFNVLTSAIELSLMKAKFDRISPDGRQV